MAGESGWASQKTRSVDREEKVKDIGLLLSGQSGIPAT
jgi:hypothetical protein